MDGASDKFAFKEENKRVFPTLLQVLMISCGAIFKLQNIFDISKVCALPLGVAGGTFLKNYFFLSFQK